MNTHKTALSTSIPVILTVFFLAPIIPAQPPRSRGPRIISPEVSAERYVTFRILAPNAEKVLLSGSDIPGKGIEHAFKSGQPNTQGIGVLKPSLFLGEVTLFTAACKVSAKQIPLMIPSMNNDIG